MDNNSDSLPWLVEDRFRLKASIRYQIKQYELQLAQQIAEIEFNKDCLRDILHVCNILIQSYERWQSLMQISHLAKIDYIPINEFKFCFLYLQELQIILAQHSDEVNEASIIDKLLFYYQNLHSLLLGEENTYSETHESDEGLQVILASEESGKWLELMANYGSKLGENLLIHRAQLLRLSEEELLRLYHQFSSQETLRLIQCLQVLKNKENSDGWSMKAISFHQFLVWTHQTIIQLLIQRGYQPLLDCLASDQLYKLPKIDDYQLVIVYRILENWRLSQLEIPDGNWANEQYVAILGAYKYCFDPTKLVDAVMALQRRLTSLSERSTLRQHSKTFYQQLSTKACFELYGYFSNNDSRYFMQTLCAASQGLSIRGLVELSVEKCESIQVVFEVIEHIFYGVIDELERRFFAVSNFSAYQQHDLSEPRDQIIQALQRIILVCQGVERDKNTRLEELFEALEKKEDDS